MENEHREKIHMVLILSALFKIEKANNLYS